MENVQLCADTDVSPYFEITLYFLVNFLKNLFSYCEYYIEGRLPIKYTLVIY